MNVALINTGFTVEHEVELTEAEEKMGGRRPVLPEKEQRSKELCN